MLLAIRIENLKKKGNMMFYKHHTRDYGKKAAVISGAGFFK